MNRKLIRPTLAEIKGKGRETTPKEQAPNGDVSGARTGSGGAARGGGGASAGQREGGGGGSSASSGMGAAGRSKRIPPTETYAEIFYYKKQMDAHTPMVIVLQDGEEIEGTIEWYDRDALKVNRKSEPNILLLKHNIKYMFKAEDREAD